VVVVSFGTYIARRTLFALLAVYLVVSVTFGVVALTPNTHLGGEVGSAVYFDRISAEERQELEQSYLEERDLDRPLSERYVGWLVGLSTLDWGYSFEYEQPVSDLLIPAIQRTSLYTIPAVVFAVLLGTALGALSGARRGIPDGAVRLIGYATVGIPAFMAAFVFLKPFVGDAEWLRLLVWENTTAFMVQGEPMNPNRRLWPPSEPLRFLVPAAVFAVSLVGWQLRYGRTAYLDRAGEEFVKLHRAKGAGWLRVARHVLRNAAVPIVSASLSELLVVVLVNVYVIETVFGIQGVAAYNIIAVRTRDMPLIIGTSLVLAVSGILASYAQDLLYGYLNPRVRA
jgi:peptide/nickel transport system permease protein